MQYLILLTLYAVLLFLSIKFLQLIELDEKKSTIRLFIVSSCIKMIVAMLLFHFIPATGFIKDDMRYYHQGAIIAKSWKAGMPIDVGQLTGSTHPAYWIYNGILFFLLGEFYLYPVTINVFLSSLAGIVFYKLVRLFFEQKIARVALMLVLFSPNIIFWTAVNSKDVLFLLMFLCILYLYYLFKSQKHRISIIHLFLFAFFVFISLYIRSYLVLCLLFIMSIDYIFWYLKKGHASYIKLLISIIAILGILIIMPTSRRFLLSFANLTIFERFYKSAILPGLTKRSYITEIKGIAGFLKLALLGSIRFLVTPLPWKAVGVYQNLIPGMVLLYLLIPSMIAGFLYTVRYKHKELTMMLLLFLAIVILYAMALEVQGPRHRLIIEPFMLLFSIIGIYLVDYKSVKFQVLYNIIMLCIISSSAFVLL